MYQGDSYTLLMSTFYEQRYSTVLWVKVTWPDGDSHTDAVKGLNRGHALYRARWNWPGATVEPLNQEG